MRRVLWAVKQARGSRQTRAALLESLQFVMELIQAGGEIPLMAR
jgi:hypothetical protein